MRTSRISSPENSMIAAALAAAAAQVPVVYPLFSSFCPLMTVCFSILILSDTPLLPWRDAQTSAGCPESLRDLLRRYALHILLLSESISRNPHPLLPCRFSHGLPPQS